MCCIFFTDVLFKFGDLHYVGIVDLTVTTKGGLPNQDYFGLSSIT